MDPIIFTTTIFQVYALHYVLENDTGRDGGGRVGKIGGAKKREVWKLNENKKIQGSRVGRIFAGVEGGTNICWCRWWDECFLVSRVGRKRTWDEDHRRYG